MGIKQELTKRVANVAGKVGDKVAKVAVLSPEQIEDVQKNRDEYLAKKPDPNDPAAKLLTEVLLAAGGVEIFHSYLPQIRDVYSPIRRDAEYDYAFNPAYNIRFFNITKWVTDKRENNLEKLVNVYEVLSNEECNIALVFHRRIKTTEVYLAVTNTKNALNNTDIENYKNRLADAIRGNFPGAEWNEEPGRGVLPCLNNTISYSVASATNVPTEKSEKFVSQTIEKLLDGIIPEKREKEYMIILMATPILDVEERKLHLGSLYSALAPYASWSTGYTYTEAEAIGSGATVGINIGVSAGVQNGTNSSITTQRGETESSSESNAQTTGESQTATEGTTDTESISETESEGTTVTDTTGTSETVGESTSDTVNASVSYSHGVNTNVKAGVNIGPVNGGASVGTTDTLSVTGGYSHTKGKSFSKGTLRQRAESKLKSYAKTKGKSLAKSVSQSVTNSTSKSVTETLGKAVSNTVGKTAGVAKSVSLGGNLGSSFARSSNVTATIGKNESINQNFMNYNIKHALEMLEQQMKRFEQSTALGMWDFAAYILSEDQNVANNVAHSYVALTQGEESYMSTSAINLWRGDLGQQSEDAREICGYLRELRHPVFGLAPAIVQMDKEFFVYPPIVTATTSLSGKELAYSLNFPQRSIAGLPVLECAEFGRNIVTYEKQGDEKILLGNIFHMNHPETANVELSKNSLASHVFITGSTGAGKSNTVYQILDELERLDTKFLVIEPAKGEYKHVFGMESDVEVYGTNPKLSKLLRINPFSFPAEIHVLEHTDRLVEIFNVCWPMYAAMPAVLKNAVEQSYVDCGWDLIESTNQYGDKLYPSFADVARNIRKIIESSDYDAENKGAYKGSLLTRLHSLTNGINGIIFTTDEISAEDLFDRNVIVDLSRIGSTETKSLLMGMLILKLQEYRMASADGMNADLKHVTVLEEAHNILKRTSSEQPIEGSNLMGKSVEMIANAIAEMRTYGEGFIIADQAPALLDMSAIRNTNTKIIMRLPDQTDRELVGKAANLNDDQIIELAKLPRGVAAVYQNEWVQPVLCKVLKADTEGRHFAYNPNQIGSLISDEQKLSQSLLECIMNEELFQHGDKEGLKELRSRIVRSKLDSAIKVRFLEYLDADEDENLAKLRQLIYEFLGARKAIDESAQHGDLQSWTRSVADKLRPSIKGYSDQQLNLTMALILYEQSERDDTYADLFSAFTETYKKGGVVF